MLLSLHPKSFHGRDRFLSRHFPGSGQVRCLKRRSCAYATVSSRHYNILSGKWRAFSSLRLPRRICYVPSTESSWRLLGGAGIFAHGAMVRWKFQNLVRHRKSGATSILLLILAHHVPTSHHCIVPQIRAHRHNVQVGRSLEIECLCYSSCRTQFRQMAWPGRSCGAAALVVVVDGAPIQRSCCKLALLGSSIGVDVTARTNAREVPGRVRLCEA